MCISCVEASIRNSLFLYQSLQDGFLGEDDVVYTSDTIPLDYHSVEKIFKINVSLQIFCRKILTKKENKISPINIASQGSILEHDNEQAFLMY